MVLRRCLLHVGLSAMKGRLEVEDTSVKCSGDSLFATADATLALRRWAGVWVQAVVAVGGRRDAAGPEACCGIGQRSIGRRSGPQHAAVALGLQC